MKNFALNNLFDPITKIFSSKIHVTTKPIEFRFSCKTTYLFELHKIDATYLIYKI